MVAVYLIMFYRSLDPKCVASCLSSTCRVVGNPLGSPTTIHVFNTKQRLTELPFHRSTGIGTLYFFVDDKLELQKRINEHEFDFQYDISPRTLVFQKSFDIGTNQSTANRHSLRIIWTHSGVRPRVAVALDSIEYM